jgi:uncharacterized glyoxalase superfamily protein PhnB
MKPDKDTASEVFPLLASTDVGRISDWAVSVLGLTESWRAAGESGEVEHAELHWFSGRIIVNIRRDADSSLGPAGISLRVDDRAVVDSVYASATAGGADIFQDLQESRVAYSFTALDPDGNQWWVNAETGFLDELRQQGHEVTK